LLDNAFLEVSFSAMLDRSSGLDRVYGAFAVEIPSSLPLPVTWHAATDYVCWVLSS